MHHETAVGTSEEVILHPTFMADVTGKKDGRKIPFTSTQQFDSQARTPLAPTHELRLTSFKSFWFFASHPFLKRLRVLRDAWTTTFFIAGKTFPNGNVCFSITCLPHAHLNAFDVHTRNTGFEGGCYTTKAGQVLKMKRTNNTRAPELTALVWNITNTTPSTFTKNLYYLITREEPNLLMVLGAQLGEQVIKTARTLGFRSITSTNREQCWMNGVTIFWKDAAFLLQQHPSYTNSMHIHVKVHVFPD